MSTILQILYDFVHWQYFGIFAIIWVVVDLVWIGNWKRLIERINKLINKPWIFAEDKNPDDPALYPRRILEQLALNSRRENRGPTESGANTGHKGPETFGTWLTVLRRHAFSAERPIRSLGSVIALAFFVFFLLADAITIANTMVLLNLISPDLPPVLQRLDLAILGGALFTAIVGVWMLIEMSGNGDLIDVSQLTSSQKQIFKVISLIVTLFSMAVMVALAVQRLISLNVLESDPTTQLIISFVLYGLLALNNSLSAALMFQPAALGLVVVIYLISEIIITVLPILAFLADIIWRTVYVLFDFLIWALFTPVIAIPYGISKIFTLFNNDNAPAGSVGDSHD